MKNVIVRVDRIASHHGPLLRFSHLSGHGVHVELVLSAHAFGDEYNLVGFGSQDHGRIVEIQADLRVVRWLAMLGTKRISEGLVFIRVGQHNHQVELVIAEHQFHEPFPAPKPVSVTIDLLLGLAGHIQKHVQPTHLKRVTTGLYGSPYRGQGGIEGGQVRPRDFLAAKAGHRRQKQEHQAAG